MVQYQAGEMELMRDIFPSQILRQGLKHTMKAVQQAGAWHVSQSMSRAPL